MLLGCLGHIEWVTVSFFEWLSSHSKIDSLPHLIISFSIFKIYSHVQPLYSILIRCHDTSERASRPMSTTGMVTQFKTVTQSINHKAVTSTVKFIGIKMSIRHTDLLYILLWLFREIKINSYSRARILNFLHGNPSCTYGYFSHMPRDRMKSNLWVFVFCSNFI